MIQNILSLKSGKHPFLIIKACFILGDKSTHKSVEEPDFELTISHAFNGQRAWSMLKDEEIDFDVILLDLKMPIMNGLDLLRLIKSHPKLKRTYVIIQSAFVEGEKIKPLLDAGANTFISKPYSELDVRSHIGLGLNKYYRKHSKNL